MAIDFVASAVQVPGPQTKYVHGRKGSRRSRMFLFQKLLSNHERAGSATTLNNETRYDMLFDPDSACH
jgi:hypothetical protein